MSGPRRPRERRLTVDERHLWAEIARLITPLRGRAPPPAPPAPAPVAAEAPRAGKGTASKGTALKPVPAKPANAKPAAAKPGKPVSAKPASAKPAVARPAPATPPAAPPLPPLAALERRLRTGLRRGSRTVDAVIDLHGLRQAEAHAALVGFLHRSRHAGHAVVLVVTGKGAAGDDPYAERGVLRRSVPHWLRLPELRPLVVGFEEAAHHHGGGGALYIRLRRRG
ncbi:Endonuclease MutS2 [Methylobacterium crusticola]|uniref:Endonuclease MutS2 n=1 Tax=Methylobacterium crusticola TaxID=1697972 RepID=A0ABQ4R4P5_9HYPH|nr:Smr/MutS family protein [Methylobacterium crusticola]GJD52618.1 Endonuclease MutS2 [Methylobacterium crusticola]